MSITYRPWREGDDLALLEIWPDPQDHVQHTDRALLQPDSARPFARGLIAEEDGVPVAAGTVAASRTEPGRLWVYVEVAPQLRGQGIGTELLRQLTELSDAARAEDPMLPSAFKARYAVDASGEPLNPAAAALCAHLGLEQINLSRSLVLAPKSVPAPNFEDFSIPTRHITDIPTGSVELAKAVHQFYASTHASWDPTSLTLGQAAVMLLSPGSGAHGALVVRTGAELPQDAPAGAKPGRIKAFAVSYTNAATEGPADVLIGADTDQDEPTQIRALADLLGIMLMEHPVKIEVDSSMSALTKIADALLKDGLAQVDTATRILASR